MNLRIRYNRQTTD